MTFTTVSAKIGLHLITLEELIYERLKHIKSDKKFKNKTVDLGFIPDTPNKMYEAVNSNLTITLAIPSASISNSNDNRTSIVTYDLVASITDGKRSTISYIMDSITHALLSPNYLKIEGNSRESEALSDIFDICCQSVLYDNIRLASYRLFPAEGNLWRAELLFNIDSNL